MIQARIRKRFPPSRESAGFSLEVEFQAARGVTVLFGPSGSGKTLTLDSIAGFVAAGRPGASCSTTKFCSMPPPASTCPPRRRHCGYVFQNYALFPHMTLRENLVFAAERWPRLERHRRVNEMLERFHLAEVAGRRPHEVSGGAAAALLHRARADRRAPPAAARRARPRPRRAPARGALRRAPPGARRIPHPHPAGDPRPRRVLRAGRPDAGAARRPHRAERRAAQGARTAGRRGGGAPARHRQHASRPRSSRSTPAAIPAACACGLRPQRPLLSRPPARRPRLGVRPRPDLRLARDGRRPAPTRCP